MKNVGVVMIDLNYLKRINDTYGHDKGNIAIVTLCESDMQSTPRNLIQISKAFLSALMKKCKKTKKK